MIEIEKTLNPNVLNFYTDKPLLDEGQSIYADKTAQTDHALIKDIFSVGGIKRALLLPDMLFIEKEDTADFELLSPLLMAFLIEYGKIEASDKELTLSKIEALIEARIRPFLVRDDGNIDVIGFNNGVLSIRFQGHCKGCPHADQTLKNIIERTLKKYLPQITEVKKEV